MDYTTMTLAELEALFATESARFATLTTMSAPTVGDIQEATKIAANLEPGGELHDTLQSAKSFAGLKGRTFAVEEPKAEQGTPTTEDPKLRGPNVTEVRPSEPAPESTGAAEKNPEVVREVPVAEQAQTDATGEVNTTAPAEQARVGHTEDLQDPVDPAQVKPGEVVGPDGKSTPLQYGSALDTLAAQGAVPEVPSHRKRGSVKIRAASGLDEFSGGESMDGLLDIARGSIERVRSFPDWQPPTGDMLQFAEQGRPMIQKFGTATIDLDVPKELVVDDVSMSLEQMDQVLNLAADETTLPGGSLTAAGGWCAPSEVSYDLSHDATDEGMLKHPEVGIRRGGIKWPVSPQFSDFYANPGFKYTEAQVIAGVTKPCITIPCPSWDEARLQVEGLCVKVDILTNLGYPEAVRNYIDGTMIAHGHWMNATKIAAMTAGLTAKVVPNQSGTFNDTLNYLEALSDRIRQKYRMRFNATMEVLLPYWVRGAIRMDLSNRTGQPVQAVTDAQIDQWFRARKLNPQWLYDWQDLPLADVGGTAGFDESVQYPATFQALFYPAGTFVFGTAPVINLSTIYDAATLQQNMYTGLFTEQAWLVAKRKFEPTLVTLPVCGAGRSGAANVTACGTAA